MSCARHGLRARVSWQRFAFGAGSIHSVSRSALMPSACIACPPSPVVACPPSLSRVPPMGATVGLHQPWTRRTWAHGAAYLGPWRGDGAVAARGTQRGRLARGAVVTRGGDAVGDGAGRGARNGAGGAGHRLLRAGLAVGVGRAGRGGGAGLAVVARDGLYIIYIIYNYIINI